MNILKKAKKTFSSLSLKSLIENLAYLFIFVLPWSTKLIIRPGDAYNEIALGANYLLLILILILFFVYKLKYSFRLEKPGRFRLLLLLLAFFSLLSALFSVRLDLSFFRFALLLLSLGLVFFLLDFKLDIKKIILIFLLSLSFQAGLGLAQFFSQKTWACKYLGLAYHQASDLGTAVVETANERFLRAYGASDHPNIFGGLMFLAFSLSLALMLKNKWRGSRQVLSYLALFLFFTAMCLSFSRSAWLVAGLACLFLLPALYFSQKKMFWKYLPIFCSVLLLGAFLFLLLKPLLLVRLEASSRLEQISINERQEQFKMAGEIIGHHPLSGVGLGAYHDQLLIQNRTWKDYEAQPVHNVFLLLGAEIGLIGLALFLLLLFYLFRRNIYDFSFYPWFFGLLSFMFFDHWLWSLSGSYLYLFFFLTLTFLFKYDRLRLHNSLKIK